MRQSYFLYGSADAGFPWDENKTFVKIKKALDKRRNVWYHCKAECLYTAKEVWRVAKNLQFVMLLDCYGEFLTQRQRQATELYYGEDLSLGEIAELAGTSRQAVRDSIKRSEEILLDMEEKLQFAKRLHALRMNYAEIAAMTENIAEKTAENPAAQQTCRAVLEKVQEGLHLL